MSKLTLTKDVVVSDVQLNNTYLKYYVDLKQRVLRANDNVIYAKRDMYGNPIMAFSFISLKDLELEDVILKEVPTVTDIDGSIIYNSGRNILHVS